MARILDALSPLVALLGQGRDPVAAAQALARTAACGADGSSVVAQLQAAITDTGLAAPVLAHAGILDDAGQLTADAAVRLAQSAVLLEAVQASAASGDGWRLVLTVPGFLRGAFNRLVAEQGDAARPVETTAATLQVGAAARSRLLLAAPFLDERFVAVLAPHVRRVLSGGGQVVVLTRALTLSAPTRSSANVAAVAALRDAAVDTGKDVTVASWEESGLGLHLKVVLADDRLAYLGSANPTPAGAAGHAEAGVLLTGPSVTGLGRWLDEVAAELARRRLPHA